MFDRHFIQKWMVICVVCWGINSKRMSENWIEIQVKKTNSIWTINQAWCMKRDYYLYQYGIRIKMFSIWFQIIIINRHCVLLHGLYAVHTCTICVPMVAGSDSAPQMYHAFMCLVGLWEHIAACDRDMLMACIHGNEFSILRSGRLLTWMN